MSAMRAALPIVLAALVFALPAAAAGWHPGTTWLAQAQCVHLKEAGWRANTGNGLFGGMQFMAATWKRVGGKAEPAFAHPGDPAYPFSATPAEQLYRAWLLWKRDGGSWRSWRGVGASCSS